jgi:tRNA (uracil-5-)-methyltransferase
LNNLNRKDYLLTFNKKKDIFSKALKSLTDRIEFFKSPYKGFRTRAEFGFSMNDDIPNYTMVKQGKRYVLNDLPICHKKINSLMPLLKNEISRNTESFIELFQIEFQVSRNQEAFISLIHHKELTPKWVDRAKEISSNLNVSIIGRSRKQKVVIGNDFITENYIANNTCYGIKLFEQCFSQPNPYVCDDMIDWTCKNIIFRKDLVELYCGIGTFTIPLSASFNKILATENNRLCTKGLEANLILNERNNVCSARLSGKETLDALNGIRDFRRLSHIDINKLECKSIFVDPPRKGLDLNTLNDIKDFDQIIYISCGFDALKRDIKMLSNTHNVRCAAFFDQFPYTDHIESGIILESK